MPTPIERVARANTALHWVRKLVVAEIENHTLNYTILYTKHPQCGQVSAEGKKELRPWKRALKLIDAALKEG